MRLKFICLLRCNKIIWRKKSIVLMKFGVVVVIIGYGCGIVNGMYCWWVGCERMFLMVKEDLKVVIIFLIWIIYNWRLINVGYLNCSLFNKIVGS